ncbi:hypothetical protein SDC9_149460 [bioreactor metagenome]|uniref:Uncharacterized protein n=1 Tax=bioreactor metagenome TaxID=1076179 RepID=A0A645ELA1_9ZZZZ
MITQAGGNNRENAGRERRIVGGDLLVVFKTVAHGLFGLVIFQHIIRHNRIRLFADLIAVQVKRVIVHEQRVILSGRV